MSSRCYTSDIHVLTIDI